MQLTEEVLQKYLAELAETGESIVARDRVGFTSGALYKYRVRHPEFKQLEEEARLRYCSKLSQEIHRRGVEGVEEAIYYKGEVVGYRIVYSDRLLLEHARRHMPDQYGQKISTTAEVSIRDQVGEKINELSPQSRDLLKQIITIESQRA